MGRIELRDGDVLPPREAARPGGDEGQREDREREGRGVEDVHPAAVPFPAQQLLGREAERHQQELEIEPVVPEPEEEVDAEDDRDGAEAHPLRVAPGPAEEQVEPVGEGELPRDERNRVVDRRPVPAPVEEHGGLRAGLQVVLGARGELERPATAAAAPARWRDGQQDVPGGQHARGAEKRPEQRRALVDARKEGERGQRERRGERYPEPARCRERDGAPRLRLAPRPRQPHRPVRRCLGNRVARHRRRGDAARARAPGGVSARHSGRAKDEARSLRRGTRDVRMHAPAQTPDAPSGRATGPAAPGAARRALRCRTSRGTASCRR